MLKMRSVLLWLVLSACATAPKTFAPIGNCMESEDGAEFSCVDSTGKSFVLKFSDPSAKTLVCFQYSDFKIHEETCHK